MLHEAKKKEKKNTSEISDIKKPVPNAKPVIVYRKTKQVKQVNRLNQI